MLRLNSQKRHPGPILTILLCTLCWLQGTFSPAGPSSSVYNNDWELVAVDDRASNEGPHKGSLSWRIPLPARSSTG